MKGLKDFLYDKNDILIALIILIVAALLIVWRMDVIMEYPHTLAEETGTQVTTDDTAVDDDAAADSSNDDTSQDEGDSAQTDTLWSRDALAHDQLICQCCGMPLDDSTISKEPDGTFNEEYCKWLSLIHI